MRAAAGRVLQQELLDHAPPAEARRNLDELIFINRRMGGHRLLRQCLAEVVSPDESFTFLDVGAASGDMSQAAQSAFPGLRAIHLDYRPLHLEKASGARVVADAFALPMRDRAVDIVHCSLFLHHFTDDEVTRLLASLWRTARRALIVLDLERHPIPYYFLPATKWLFRWGPLVVHDGPISVEAAFLSGELTRLAERAGIPAPLVRRHRPAFRLSLVARRQD